MLLAALALRQKVELVGSKANVLSRATISHCLAELRNRMRLFLTRSFLPCVCVRVCAHRGVEATEGLPLSWGWEGFGGCRSGLDKRV